MDVWVYEWIRGWMDKRMDLLEGEWWMIEEWMGGWVDERMDGWVVGR